MDIKNPLRPVGVLNRGVGGGRGPRPDRHGRTRSYGSERRLLLQLRKLTKDGLQGVTKMDTSPRIVSLVIVIGLGSLVVSVALGPTGS